LYQAHTLEETAKKAGLSVDEARAALDRARVTLLEFRGGRPRPHLDDKILTGWNAMMISALAKGAQILEDETYASAARRALAFIRSSLWVEGSQRLLRRYRDGESAVDGFLDDYALLISALVDMYETSFEAGYLEWAKLLAARAIELFEDRERGGFFSTTGDAEDVLLRLKDDYDGAEPSGNSVTALALLRLARLTGVADFAQAAERTLRAFASRLLGMPAGLPQMLVALEFSLAPPMEVVLAGPREDPVMTEMLRVTRGRFLPNAVVMRAEDVPASGQAGDKTACPTAYVCENYACNLPVTEPAELDKLLRA